MAMAAGPRINGFALSTKKESLNKQVIIFAAISCLPYRIVSLTRPFVVSRGGSFGEHLRVMLFELWDDDEKK